MLPSPTRPVTPESTQRNATQSKARESKGRKKEAKEEMPPSRAGEKLEAGISKPLIASSSSRGIKARGRDLQVPVSANWLHLHHPCILGGPQQREQNQNSKPTPGVTMMHHATKRGFKDCPGFLNSTGRLGPKRGRKCYITPAFSGVPNKGNKIKTQNLCRGSP